MRDFFYVNILNEGMIPWIMEKGPLFYYYTAAGVYDLLSRDPRVKIEITTRELAEQRKREFLAKYAKTVKVATPIENVKIEDKLEIAVEPKVQNDEFDDEIDAILEKAPEVESAIKLDVSKIPDPEPITDADGFVIYSEEQITKMTKKQLKEILESRGHAAGQRLVKNDDPFSPLYHDSVEELREKVRKSQETF